MGADGRRGGEAPADALILPARLAGEMARRLEAAYPKEGCGVLLGRRVDGERRVERLEPAPNRWPDRDDRYLVDPRTLRRLLEEEDDGGPEILGFYHSHPDAPPEPSETDRAHAWPWYHYLIVPVAEGEAGEGRAWELAEPDGDFRERGVRVIENGGPAADRDRPGRDRADNPDAPAG